MNTSYAVPTTANVSHKLQSNHYKNEPVENSDYSPGVKTSMRLPTSERMTEEARNQLNQRSVTMAKATRKPGFVSLRSELS